MKRRKSYSPCWRAPRKGEKCQDAATGAEGIITSTRLGQGCAWVSFAGSEPVLVTIGSIRYGTPTNGSLN